ncbi:hypothetical protein QTP81_13665 [Alteromonas sp. ASW11-36]|uniref:Uncharacterized protein n=1 Tax=Alteromonas arenosi TaxID=3055817 RepID=A0ABT7SZM8_9ALTE|nr:hypothetical protein [Alteromonas sp. ASW11-36]MDM7861643.1 hypothetical protein [Alteromonas sp. ASW11-36]
MSRTKKVTLTLSSIVFALSVAVIVLWFNEIQLPHQMNLPMHLGVLIVSISTCMVFWTDAKALLGEDSTLRFKLQAFIGLGLILTSMIVPTMVLIDWFFENSKEGYGLIYGSWLSFSLFSLIYFAVSSYVYKICGRKVAY